METTTTAKEYVKDVLVQYFCVVAAAIRYNGKT